MLFGRLDKFGLDWLVGKFCVLGVGAAGFGSGSFYGTGMLYRLNGSG